MRHHYLALTKEDLDTYKTLRFYTCEGMTVGEAAHELGISHQKAGFILARGRMTTADLRERRKVYIVKVLTNRRTAHRHTPHVIGAYFKVDESYVSQLIRELRNESRLPPVQEGDKEWQDDLLKMLRRKFPNVFKAETVGKKKEHGDKLYVAGKGWVTWTEAKDRKSVV